MGDILGGTLSTNENGRTTLSGVGSNIKFGKTIDKIIEAKRQPAVKLENKIQTNQTRVDALNELQSRLVNLKEAANKLRGKASIDNSNNIFEAKEGFLTASRSDNQEPSPATSILTANVENNAEVGTHQLEVLQTAQSQRIASDTVSDPSKDLNLSGTFEINGRSINVQSNDSLADVRDTINETFDDLDKDARVTAGITNVASDKSILTIQGPQGVDLTLADTSGSVLDSIGVLDGSGNVKNQIQSAQVAKFRADGLSDGSVAQTSLSGVTDPDAALNLSGNGDLTFTVPNGPENLTRSVEVDGTDSLNSIADKVNGVQGVNAEVVENDSGEYALQFAAGTPVNAQQSGFFDTGTTLSDMGLDEPVDLTLTDTSPSGAISKQTLTLDPSNDSMDELGEIQAAINSGSGPAAARIVTNSDGQESLVIESRSGGRLDITDDANGSAVDALQLDRELERGEVQSDKASLVVSDAVERGATLDELGITNNQEINVAVTKADGTVIGPSSVNVNDYTNKTIRDVRDAINDQAGGAQATIINDGGKDRLAIRPTEPGATVRVWGSSSNPTGQFARNQLNQGTGNEAPDASQLSDYEVPGLLVGSENTDGAGNPLGSDNTVVGDGSESVGDGLKVGEADILTRQTNTVDDLYEGTTINLRKAEPGTNLKFEIERDQDQANRAIQEFVSAFNSVKKYINAQQQERALEGQDPDAENTTVGALNGETVLSRVEQGLNRIIQTGAENADSDLTFLGALGQQAGSLGISYVNNDNLEDPTNEDTLTINQSRLNDALLNNFEDVRNLFEFDFQSPNSGLTLLGTSEETGAADGELSVRIDADGNVKDGGPHSVTIDGDPYNVKETSANVLEVQEGPLKGLTLQTDLAGTGSETTKSVNISTSTGIGFNGFHSADRLGTNSVEGVVQSEIDRLIGRDSPDIQGQNERYEEEIERIERRLESERERLRRQFTAMEQALLELESAKQRLSQFTGGGSSNN